MPGIKIEKLSDLRPDEIPDGFTIVYDGDKPVATITNYKYYV